MIIRSVEDIFQSLLNEKDKKHIKYIYNVKYINNTVYEYENINYRIIKVFSVLNISVCEFAEKLLPRDIVYNTTSPIKLWKELIAYFNSNDCELHNAFYNLKKLRNIFMHSDLIFHSYFNYCTLLNNVYKIITVLISNNIYEYIINFVIIYKKMLKIMYLHLNKTSKNGISDESNTVESLLKKGMLHGNYYEVTFKHNNSNIIFDMFNKASYNICNNTGSIILLTEGKYKNTKIQISSIKNDVIICNMLNNKSKTIRLSKDCNINIINKMIKM